MIEFILWVTLGALGGWIGFLATRTNEKPAVPYIAIGIVIAIIAGFMTKLITAQSSLWLTPNSLIVALSSSFMLVIIFGLLSNSNTNRE